jgi:hypothetical protein
MQQGGGPLTALTGAQLKWHFAKQQMFAGGRADTLGL